MSTKRLTAKVESEIRDELLSAVGFISDTSGALNMILKDGPDLLNYHKQRTVRNLTAAINRLIEVRSTIAFIKL